MGVVKKIRPVMLSDDEIVLESGKIMKVFWKDNTFNNLFRRMKF